MSIRPLFAAGAFVLLSGCATMSAQVTVERELLQADKAFSDLSAQQGMATAFLTYMDPANGLMVRPGGMIEGQQQFRDAFTNSPPGVSLTWSPDRAYASSSGDFGVTSGRFTRNAPGQAAAQGRYVTVWRRDAQGIWRALIDIGNTDPDGAPAQPATPLVQDGPQPLQPPPVDPMKEPNF